MIEILLILFLLLISNINISSIISRYYYKKNIYKIGNGTLRLRGSYIMEGHDIVINSLPYQISGNKILEQIATQMRNKKLPQVEDLRDESDHEEPIRLVITPKSRKVNVDELMSHLFSTTSLEKIVRINMNIINLKGKPKTYSLIELLHDWIIFRKSIHG